MKIWLVKRTDTVHYDEYDGAVVVAENEKHAIELLINHDERRYQVDNLQSWDNFKNIEVTEIAPINAEVILASFEAG